MTGAVIAIAVALFVGGGFVLLALWLLFRGHSGGDYPPSDDDGTAWGI